VSRINDTNKGQDEANKQRNNEDQDIYPALFLLGVHNFGEFLSFKFRFFSAHMSR
jgi:hypothetical protein